MASSIGGTTIDVNGIVQALMNVERQPLTRLETRATSIQSTISEVGKLQSALSTFQDAAQDLTDSDTWGAATATSSDDTAVAVTATSGALQGSYALQVNQLASHQTIVTTTLADKTDVVGGGQIVVELGNAANGFTADPDRTPITIDIPTGATLEEVSAAINAADAGIGASLVTDANGTRLMIRSADSGANNAFRLQATTDGSSQSTLDIASLGFSPGQPDGAVSSTESASNALFTLNGLALESTTNQPEGVLESVALKFNSVTTSPIDVEIVTDGEAIKERLDSFISTYNEVNSLLRQQTRYDEATGTAGPLQGNRTIVMIQEQLRNILRTSLPAPAEAGVTEPYSRLSDIGIEIQRDGSLSINDSQFEVAANNPGRLQGLFASGGLDTSQHGFARRFDTLITNLLSIDGAVTGATETLRSQKDNIEDQQDRLNRRLEDIQERLLRQYTSLDANLARLNGALQSVSQLL
ncbi:MAG: flagellar filament capping protein FliD [Burkholderiaceae bacterium]